MGSLQEGLTIIKDIQQFTTEDMESYVKLAFDEEELEVNVAKTLFIYAHFKELTRKNLRSIIGYVTPTYEWKDGDYVKDISFIDGMKQVLGEDDYYKRLGDLLSVYSVKCGIETMGLIGKVSSYLSGKTFAMSLNNVAVANGYEGKDYDEWVAKYMNLFTGEVLKYKGEKTRYQLDMLLQRIFMDMQLDEELVK